MIDVSIVPNMQYLRTEELLLRWLELSAVADGIFRTHIGNLPNSSVQVPPVGQTVQCAKTPIRTGPCRALRRPTSAARRSTSCVCVAVRRACVCVFVSSAMIACIALGAWTTHCAQHSILNGADLVV
jgi:hypothetical protein